MDALLAGPLVFTPVELPEGKRYRIEGQVAIGNLFVTEREPANDANPSDFKLYATPTGFEGMDPEDTDPVETTAEHAQEGIGALVLRRS
jgi:hypothetical protein